MHAYGIIYAQIYPDKIALFLIIITYACGTVFLIEQSHDECIPDTTIGSVILGSCDHFPPRLLTSYDHVVLIIT